MLLMNVETYGTYLVQALTSDSVDTGNNTDRIMINGSNLGNNMLISLTYIIFT